jgi:Calcineurin-like phosphoesterase
MSTVRTRVLIISDTHGMELREKPLMSVDVAIHCGDLTNGSKLEEFRTAIRLIKAINAPLKLVIAGNHDFTLDTPAFERKVAEAIPALDSDLVAKEYGFYGNARQLLEDARHAGIIFLDEGNHQFKLTNGALLKVYASPWTPALGAWGFQYPPSKGHNFSVDGRTDIVITHGPPKGIMDFTLAKERAGCPVLFWAIARARPAIHCFGHIHEGWGAKLVAWRPGVGELGEPNHFNAIDNDRSVVIETLAGITPSRFDTPGDLREKQINVDRYSQERCCATSHCTGDEHPIRKGEYTLFVNAALEGDGGLLTQKPFLVEIELAKASKS